MQEKQRFSEIFKKPFDALQEFFQKTSDEFLIKLYIPCKGFSNSAAKKLRNLLLKNLKISIGDRNCELYDISCNYSIHGIYQEEVCLKDEDLTSISFKVKRG